MTAFLIGYARCSKDEQSITVQREGLAALGVTPDRIYVDHGADRLQPRTTDLREALAACRDGDTLVVTKLDRLARSLPDAGDRRRTDHPTGPTQRRRRRLRPDRPGRPALFQRVAKVSGIRLPCSEEPLGRGLMRNGQSLALGPGATLSVCKPLPLVVIWWVIGSTCRGANGGTV